MKEVKIMPNERKTEILTRKYLTELGYYSDNSIKVEEQLSDNPIIKDCLKKASKSGSGIGKPEFIIQFLNTNTLIVIECKASTNYHESINKNKYADYAVDGALLYGKTLEEVLNIFVKILPKSYRAGYIHDMNSCSKGITDTTWHIEIKE